ncbi:MAG: AraC family transcriptional regulator [Saprospiraceae bacterium]|nr:AraC family transcriptional regulator [Saprospiraceae bacterium]
MFNIPANKLLNAVIDVKEHPLTASLAERLNGVAAISPAIVQQVSTILQAYPLQPVSHSTLTFLELIRNTSENKIGSILKNTGIELRTLQRKFKAEVGLTPKEFIRIVRMKRLEADISSGKNLLQIVADFDFADQSHLIKEFKDLRSFTPGELINKKLLLSDQFPVPDYFNL